MFEEVHRHASPFFEMCLLKKQKVLLGEDDDEEEEEDRSWMNLNLPNNGPTVPEPEPSQFSKYF